MTAQKRREAAKYFVDHAKFDCVVERLILPGFVEYVVRYGGDVLIYRVYEDGDDFVLAGGWIYERWSD